MTIEDTEDNGNGSAVTTLNGYCATQLINSAVISYSKIWFLSDRHYRADKEKSAPKLANILLEIANNYGVTRTLAAGADIQKWQAIAQYVLDLKAPTATNYVAIVEKMADDFIRTDSKGKQRRPLSAASKLLWFRFRFPIRIYDDRAVRALRRMKQLRGNVRSYENFCVAWEMAFNQYKKQLLKSLDTVSNQPEFTLMPQNEWKGREEIFNADWFVERAFDQFLWLMGDKKIKFAPFEPEVSLAKCGVAEEQKSKECMATSLRFD